MDVVIVIQSANVVRAAFTGWGKYMIVEVSPVLYLTQGHSVGNKIYIKLSL